MKNQPPELFSERPVRSDFARANAGRSGPSYALRRLMTVGVLLAIVGGGLYAAFGHGHHRASGDIPTIKGLASYKERPAHPGGIDIPNQDMQVYQALSGSEAGKPQVEHLLPPPEAPHTTQVQAPSPTSSVNITDADTAEPVRTIDVSQAISNKPIAPGPVEQLIEPSSTPPITTTVMQSPKSTPAPVAKSQPAVMAAISAPTVPAAIAPITVAPAPLSPPIPAPVPQAVAPVAASTTSEVLPTKGETVVQLASVKDEAIAKRDMNTLQTKYTRQLGAVHLRVVRADLGAKGIYYRIQSQPLSLNQANTLCSALKQNNAGCIIVR